MPLFSRKSRMDESQETHSFDDIVKGFQYAVNSAQEMLATQQLEMFLNYFNSDGTAKSQTIVTPMQQKVDIPIVTLVPHHSLAIDEVTINFTTRINRVSTQEFRGAMLQGKNTPSVYRANGYKSRDDYFADLSRSYGVPLFVVFQIADIVGEEEEFDALPLTLDDYGSTLRACMESI